MKKKMTKIKCLKCMSLDECQCLPEHFPNTPKAKLSSKLYIYRTGIVETPKALKVILAKQKLDNGVMVKSGTHVWIPYAGTKDILNGGRVVSIPNWKLNELIRMWNLDKIKKS